MIEMGGRVVGGRKPVAGVWRLRVGDHGVWPREVTSTLDEPPPIVSGLEA